MLRAAGAGPEDVVAIELPRSIEWVQAMLAVWQVGAAWTAILPSLPEARRAAMRQTAAPRFSIDRDGVHRGAQPPPAPAPPGCGPLAYVAFTSGSSGRPRGVRIEHGGIVPMLDAQIAAFSLDARARALWVLSPGFDASVSDVGTALLSGGALLIDAPDVLADPDRLLRVLSRREVRSIDLPPSVLARLDTARLPASLQTIIIGGEVADRAAVRAAARRHRVVNVYGPTEATVCSSLELCTPDHPGDTIGAPLSHLRYREVEGELWISGPGLARDYAGDPEATAERFVWREGLRWYRTGDRASPGEGGRWRFAGRLDRQVQLGGRRAEPAEVEAAFCALGLRAAVVPRALAGRTALVAFVEGEVQAGLSEALAQRLPAWLLPARILPLAALPRTEREKVDLQALAALPLPEASRAWPTDPAALRVARLFARTLGQPVVGPEDSFFELGGDSLAVLSLLARAESEGLGITASQLYAAPSPAALAALSEDPEWRTTAALLKAEGLDADAPAYNPGPPQPLAPGAQVVLTGATGFLGAQLRRALIARGYEVVSLVRAPSDEAARARVGGPAFAADVRRPRCGLSPADYAACVASAGCVVHLAAQVSLVASFERLASVNVDGTAHALALASDAGAPFVYASTLSVFVASARPPQRALEDDDAMGVGALAGGYAQSKWVAEQRVRRAAVPSCILRYGLLTPELAQRSVAPDDWLARFSREVLAAGRIPPELEDARLAFDATPVDHAAEATARLVAAGARGVVHIAGAEPVSARRLADALRAALPKSAAPGAALGEARLLGAARAEGGPRFVRQRALDLFAASGWVFDDRRARGYGVVAPAVSDAYLRACVLSWLRGGPRR